MFAYGALALLKGAPPAVADDIYKGLKGSTDVQLDLRAGYIRNDKGIETIANTLIMKYWPENVSWWAFTITPYKFTNGTRGTGDMTVGAGPRMVRGKFGFLPYVGAVLPTGQLSNGRFDEVVGLLGTYKTLDSKFEAGISTQYTFAGKKSGAEQPNEFYFGAVAGGGSLDLRAVGGLTYLRKGNGDFLTRLRAVIRYTFSKYLHIEFAAEKGVAGKNIPKDYSAALYVRVNIPNNK